MGLALLLLLLADSGSRVREFTAETVGLVRSLSPHRTFVYSVEFGGRYLATGGGDNRIILHSQGMWKPVRVLEGHSQPVRGLAFHPNGRRLVSGGLDGTVRLWDALSGREMHKASHGQFVFDVRLSAKAKLVASAGSHEVIRLWDSETLKYVRPLEGHQAAVQAVAFSADGKMLASASLDGTVRLWDVEDGSQLRAVSVGEPMSAVVFAPDGKLVYAAGAAGTIHAYDVQSGARRAEMEGHEEQVAALAVTAGGRYLVSAAGETLRVWDLSRYASVAELKHHTGIVQDVAISPEGQFLASASRDMQVKVWGDVPGGMSKVRPKGFLGVQVTEDGDVVVVSQVLRGTAAERAGVKDKDVILSIGGVKVSTIGETISEIGKHCEGDDLDVVLRRGGREITLKIKLGRWEDRDQPR